MPIYEDILKPQVDPKITAQALRERERIGEGLSGTGVSMISQPNEAYRKNTTAMTEALRRNAQAEEQRKIMRDQMAATQEEREWMRGHRDRALDYGLEEARLRASGAGSLAGTRLAHTMETKHWDNVRKLSEGLEKIGAPLMEEGAKQVDDLLTKYKDSDIPGVGPLGRYSVGDEAVRMQNTMQIPMTILLKAYSGGAVTDAEFERMEKVFGMNWKSTDDDFRQAWKLLKDRVEASKRNIVKGYKPDVYKSYMGNTNAEEKLNSLQDDADWMNSDPSTWTEEQMDQFEQANGEL